MPAINERIVNRPLAGHELTEIIKAHVAKILSMDGMYNSRIAFQRVAYEVRVTLHLDNPSYPEHISTILSRGPSIQEGQKNPELNALEPGPLKNASDEAFVVSTEIVGQIQSPNGARIEHDLPMITTVKNDNGARIDKEIRYTGDKVDPAEVGNTSEMKDVIEVQAAAWKVPSRGRGKRGQSS